MTTPDAIAQLNRDNDDLVLVRVAGSVAIQRLEGQFNWIERDQILRAAVNAADQLEK